MRVVLNLIFSFSFILGSVAGADDTLPAWTDIQSGWTASALNPQRVLFTYKSGRAHMVIDRTPVEFTNAGLNHYFQHEFKADSKAKLATLLKGVAGRSSPLDISFETVGGLTVATLTTRFSAFEKETLLSEKFWLTDDHLFWHLIYLEQSLTAIPDDLHGPRLLQEKILKRASEMASFGTPLLNFLLEGPFAIAQEAVRGVGSSTAPRSSSVAISPECLASGFDTQYLRQGPPAYDVTWSSFNQACKNDLKKIGPAVYAEAKESLEALLPSTEPADRPECHALKPKLSSDQPGATAATFDQHNKWLQCVRLAQLKSLGSSAVRVVTDPETYRTIFRGAARITTATFDFLTAPPEQQSAEESQLVTNAYAYVSGSIGRRITNLECLNHEAQGEAVCKYAADGAAVLGAAACAVVTRGKCFATLKSKLESLAADAVKKFEKVSERVAASVDEARVARAEAQTAKRAGELEKNGLANVRHNFDCNKINQYYPGSFPDRSTGCTAIKAEKDIEGVFCSCGKIDKRTFNFLSYCPSAASGYQTVAKYTSGFTLPKTAQLDYCTRVTIPKGKECYSGPTKKVFNETLAGVGGEVQLFCFNGISDRQKKLGLSTQKLSELDMRAADPEKHVMPIRWSPFTEFPEYQKVVQHASEVCKTTCSLDAFAQLEREFAQGSSSVRFRFRDNPEQLERLKSEEALFTQYLQELRMGQRNPLPPLPGS